MATITLQFRDPGTDEVLSEAMAQITVTRNEDTGSITPERDTVQVGLTTTFQLTSTPADVDEIVWRTANPDIAAISDSDDGSATVTGVAVGETNVLASFFRNNVLIGSAVATIVVVDGGGGGAVEEGLYDLNADGIEQIHKIACFPDGNGSATFGSLTFTCGIAYAYNDGIGVYDLSLREDVYRLETDEFGGDLDNGPFFTVAPLHFGGQAGFIFGGQNGWGIANTEGDVSESNPFFRTFDTYPVNGDPATGYATSASPVDGFCEWGPQSGGMFGFNRMGCVPPDRYEGEPVSSYRIGVELASPVFEVTRGFNISRLYYRNADSDTPILAFDVDFAEVRKNRCATDGAGNYACGFTLNQDNQLALYSYATGGVPTFAGFVPVGDGPVGFDVKYRPDNTFGFVVANFNDDTVTHVTTDADLNVLSSSTRAVPTDFRPGSVIWLTDDDRDMAVVSGFGAGTLFVIDF